MGSKSDVSAFFRLRFRNGLGTKPAGALLFRMRSRRSFLRLCLVAEVSLCLVAEVSQWLGHDSIVFRGSKSNVSRFLRLQFPQWLGRKTCWVFLFNGFQKRRFGIFPAAFRNGLFAWLGHYFFVFSLFFCLFYWVPKATFRHFSGCGFAMVWAQNLLGLCLFGCAPDAAFLGFAWWLKFRFAWWLKFRSGWGTLCF